VPDVAALNVVISADTKDLEAGLARAEQSVSKAGSAIQSALGGALIAGIAGVGAAVAGSVKSAADFEKQISAIVAVSGEGAESIGRIRDEALRLGKDTSFSASEAAAGMEEMIKAGLTVEQVIGGAAQATLDLAAASGTAVAESATIMSNALNTFKADNMAAADAASILAGAANASATSVHELGYGLASVGNVAATVGMSFGDTASLLALFAQNGLKGSDAGTSLKTMMLNLQPTTKAQIAEFERLGIATVAGGEAFSTLKAALLQTAEGQKAYDKMTKEGVLTTENMWKAAEKLGMAAVKGTTSYERWLSVSGNLNNAFFDQNGKVKDAASMADVLNKAMAGLTQQEKLASLEIMFGTDAIRAAAIMANGGAEAVTTMTEAMKKQGDIQKLAAERLNNVMGSLEKLKGSLETGAIVLGSMFLPALKRAIDGLTDFANKGIDAIQMLPEVWGDVVAAFTGGQLDDALDTLLTDVLGFSAATAQGFQDVIAAAGQMWAGLQPILVGIATAIQENIAPIAAFVAGFLGAIGAAGLFTAAIAAVTAVLTLLLSPIGLVAIAVGLLAAAWTTNFMGIQEATAAAWAYLLPIFTQIVDWLGPKISAVLTWLTTTGWPAMLAAATVVGTWITTVAIPALTQLVDWLGPKLSAVVTWIYTTGWPSLVTAGETVVTVVTAILTWFTDLFTALEQRAVFTELGVIWTTLSSIGEKLWSIIQKIIDVFTPFKALGDQFNTGTGALMVGMFAKLAETMGLTVGPIELISKGLSGLFAIISLQLSMVEKFISYLDKIAAFKMPSFNLPGGGGGGTQNLSLNTGGPRGAGAPVSEDEIDAYIYDAAVKRGHDPNTAIAVSRAERINIAAMQSGDSGSSFGPYQLHYGGMAPGGNSVPGMGEGFTARTGKHASDISTWREQVDYVLDNLSQTGWTPFHAAEARGIGPRQGVGTGAPRSNAPGVMDRIPLGPPEKGGTGSDPSQWPGFMAQVNEQLPAYLTSLDTIQGKGVLAFNGTAQAATVASGAVVQQMNLMGTGSVAQITDMGGQIITKLTETSGLSSTTVTNMAGVVLSQMTTLKDGTVIQMDDLGVKTTTAFNTMSQLTTTTVTTMAGTIITTTTDMNGQIVAQTIATGMAVQQQWVTTSAAVIATATAMGLEVLGQSRVMGDGLVTATKTSTGEMVSIITNAAGEVIGQFKNIVEAGKTVATGLDAAKGGLKSYADGLKGVGDAARKAADQLAEFNKQAGGGKASEFAKGKTGSGSFGKAAGGSVNANQVYMVGEQGPELFMSGTGGTIIPNHRLGGGGPVTVVNVSVNGSLVAQNDLEDTIAHAVATSLRNGSLAWSG
jgi:TP901 family phage tail tape measure protein